MTKNKNFVIWVKTATLEQSLQEVYIRDSFINGISSPMIRQSFLENKTRDADCIWPTPSTGHRSLYSPLMLLQISVQVQNWRFPMAPYLLLISDLGLAAIFVMVPDITVVSGLRQMLHVLHVAGRDILPRHATRQMFCQLLQLSTPLTISCSDHGSVIYTSKSSVDIIVMEREPLLSLIQEVLNLSFPRTLFKNRTLFTEHGSMN